MDWSYFDKPEFEMINGKYLPDIGEGETMATQIVTAVNKLVYKWYNDGDVYDNTRYMTGWCNDLSSYANWLHKHTKAAGILEGIWECMNDSEYEDLLVDLADTMLDDEDLEKAAKLPKVDSIYDCDGPFEFNEMEDDEDEDW